MAISLNVSIDVSGLDGIARVIQRAIDIFVMKVGRAFMQAIARVMPYNQRPGRRPKPPFSKSGRAVKSLRAVMKGRRTVSIYGEGYLSDLQRAGWDVVGAAWRIVKPQLQNLLNEAVREAQ